MVVVVIVVVALLIVVVPLVLVVWAIETVFRLRDFIIVWAFLTVKPALLGLSQDMVCGPK